jgi:hypothetical protein
MWIKEMHSRNRNGDVTYNEIRYLSRSEIVSNTASEPHISM